MITEESAILPHINKKYEAPSEKTIQQLFEEQIIKTPKNLAVIHEGKGRIYKKLNQYTNQLVRYLKKSAAGKETSDIISLKMVSLSFIIDEKVDKPTQPETEPVGSAVAVQYLQPLKQLENVLVAIWKEILDIEQVGIEDNFFELGGHSLLATQIISRIRIQLKIEIPLKTLFELPTIVGITEEILHQQKRRSTISPLELQPRPDALPLSFAQQRLWFIEQLLVNRAIYNIPLAISLSGTLDEEALNKAFSNLLLRHEILRTHFQQNIMGIPEQIICSPDDCILTISKKDLKDLLIVEQQQTLLNHIETEALTPFDLTKAPLMRIQWLQLADDKITLLINMHHSISDRWSLAILAEEISAFYNHYAYQKSLNLLPLHFQYADYALWQRKYLSDEILEKQFSYWQKQLTDIPERLNLFTDKIRPQNLSYKGDQITFHLEKEIVTPLKAIASSEQASLFMAILTTFYILLYRYTNQETLVIGAPVTNRQYKEIEGLIGFFVNTLALKVEIPSEITFNDLLERVRKTVLEGQAHQDLPFEQLAERLQVKRSSNHHPIFDVMLVIENNREAFTLEGIKTEKLNFNYPIAKFDLILWAEEKADGSLLCAFKYATDLFEATTIERMAKHFIYLVQGIVKKPTETIQTFPLLNELERQQVLVEWNQTQVTYPSNKTVHQLFEEQVEKTPNNVAVVFENQSLTYKELNGRANQLAHYLQNFGVKAEVLVAISLERSLELIIATLGILKAGGAYVPLDPNYPQERLKYILEDAQVKYMITHSALRHIVKVNDTVKLFCLDIESENLSTMSVHNILEHNSAQNLAYIIYTSGSTGKPKGVMVEHKGIPNLIYAHLSHINVTAQSRILQVASFNFDASVCEWAMALLSGASLYLIRGNECLVGQGLIDVIKRYEISVVTLVPSILATIDKKDIGSLKLETLVVAGEAISEQLLKDWRKRIPHIINAYGPTEATVCASLNKYTDAHLSSYIGRPLNNTQLYILDKNLQPVPIGAVGELYIGGLGVARGYLNKPNLTKSVFISNPFMTNEDKVQNINTHLYKTGDLVQYFPDRNINYLGRIDHQVKIRGCRIELNEIETIIRQFSQIKNVIVVLREDEPTHKQLAAYIITDNAVVQNELHEKELLSLIRHQLDKSLPKFMIPSHFIIVEQFPLSPNGKLDIKALPTLERQHHTTAQNFIKPRNTLETQIALIWSTLLNEHVDRISIHDNFFGLGGHSLLLIQLMVEVNKLCCLLLSLADFYDHPTIASLTTLISFNLMNNKPSKVLDNKVSSVLWPINNRVDKRMPLFLVHGGGTTALPYLCFNEMDKQVYGLNNPFFGQSQRFNSATEMAKFYLAEIKSVQAQGPYYLGGWSFGGTIALEMAQQLISEGDKVEIVILIDTIHSLNKPQTEKECKTLARLEENPHGLMTELVNKELAIVDSLLKHYQPKIYEGRVILIKARKCRENSIPEIQSWLNAIAQDPFNSWEEILPFLEVYSVNATHDDLFKYEHASYIVDKIQSVLSATQYNNINENLTLIEYNFLLAAQQQDTDLIKLYIQRKFNINVQDNTGRSALHWAAYHGNKIQLHIFLEANININLLDNEGYTALNLAQQQGHTTIVEKMTSLSNF